MKYLIIVPSEHREWTAVLKLRSKKIGRVVQRNELIANTGEDWFPPDTFGVELNESVESAEALRLYAEITGDTANDGDRMTES